LLSAFVAAALALAVVSMQDVFDSLAAEEDVQL